MTREKQAKKDCAIIVDDCVESGTIYASGYNKGIEMGVKWADKNTLNMVQKFIENHQMSFHNSGHSDAFVDGYNNALVHIRDFLSYELTTH